VSTTDAQLGCDLFAKLKTHKVETEILGLDALHLLLLCLHNVRLQISVSFYCVFADDGECSPAKRNEVLKSEQSKKGISNDL
jgi:hypothetical protein